MPRVLLEKENVTFFQSNVIALIPPLGLDSSQCHPDVNFSRETHIIAESRVRPSGTRVLYANDEFFFFFSCSSGAVGGEGGDEDDKEKEEEAERERQEAIREAEERRKEKHRKMEEEREKMRQEIRDKVSCWMLFII